jgi:hypothetical protein
MTEAHDRANRFQSFAEFYPFYLGEHADPRCRALHYVGTTLTFALLIMAVIITPLWLLAIPVAGYGFAWVAHFFIEKNKPATFTYPWWSLIGDYKMYFSWLTNKLPAQLKAAGVAT